MLQQSLTTGHRYHLDMQGYLSLVEVTITLPPGTGNLSLSLLCIHPTDETTPIDKWTIEQRPEQADFHHYFHISHEDQEQCVDFVIEAVQNGTV